MAKTLFCTPATMEIEELKGPSQSPVPTSASPSSLGAFIARSPFILTGIIDIPENQRGQPVES
jgi:hypothetical protein